ncbi:hypothetical protein BCR43DRAFT_485334 [Syncephalastrum racemosum]|uniref:Uncharacterized protein n=1 Tax=Syncephalastrum racemosum TaxID=13706 RepID=A0A1X2HM77_SYNRA|nr:hypothetical protein BCR43DRAFT_485334 [Syncephalastrum racemosum]
MGEKLPAEVLRLIGLEILKNSHDRCMCLYMCRGGHVPLRNSKNDLYTCLFVCRSWYFALIEVLHEQVTIRSRAQMRRFMKALRTSHDENPRPVGTYLRELKLEYEIAGPLVGIDVFDFETLPYYLPKLEILDFSPRIWRSLRFSGILTVWKTMQQLPAFREPHLSQALIRHMGSFLRRLQFQAPFSFHIFEKPGGLPRVLAHLPYLTSLEMWGATYHNNNDDTPLPLYLDDLRTLYSGLPHLESIRLVHVSMRAFDHEGLQPSLHLRRICAAFEEPIPVPHTLRHMHLAGVLDNIRWFKHFSRDLTQVSTLDIAVGLPESGDDEITDEERQFGVQVMDAIINDFTQLRNLRIDYDFGFHLPEHRQLGWLPNPEEVLGHLLRKGTLLESINYKGGVEPWPSSLEHYLKVLNVLDPSITYLSLKLWGNIPDTAETMSPVYYRFRDLTVLRLVGHEAEEHILHAPIEMDTLLDCCPHVRSLTVQYVNFHLKAFDPDADANLYPQHPLIELGCSNVNYHPDVFLYLSMRCRSMRRLMVDYIGNGREHGGRQVLIDMPYTSFEYVELSNLALHPGYYSSSNSICSAAFFAVKSRVFTEKEANRTIALTVQDAPRQDFDKAAFTRWYHLYTDPRTHQSRVRRLRSLEAELVRSYQNAEKDWLHLMSAAYRGTFPRHPGDWREDLPYGYGELRCHSIASLVLEHHNRINYSIH